MGKKKKKKKKRGRGVLRERGWGGVEGELTSLPLEREERERRERDYLGDLGAGN